MKNREIKFRGLTINGDWVSGLLAKKGDEWYISNSAGSPFAFQVRPETIGQFIGLYDRNMIEIYEGDVVDVCLFNDELRLYQIKIKNISKIPSEFYGSKFTWSKVIGNIYENPELL